MSQALSIIGVILLLLALFAALGSPIFGFASVPVLFVVGLICLVLSRYIR